MTHIIYLRTPLRIADAAAVLVLEILRIRLDVENVTSVGLCLCRAFRVRARDRLQAGERGIQLGVVVQLRLRLLLGRRGREGGLED